MNTFNAYAATAAHGPLQPYSFDPGPLGVEDVEIKVSHRGICHSDLSMLDNEWGMSKYPFVPGHEVTDTVAALGDEAKGLKIGQRWGWAGRRTGAPLATSAFPATTICMPTCRQRYRS